MLLLVPLPHSFMIALMLEGLHFVTEKQQLLIFSLRPLRPLRLRVFALKEYRQR
jgi:hypothetical protein